MHQALRRRIKGAQRAPLVRTAVLAALVAAAVAAASSCGSNPAAPVPASRTTTTHWRQLGTWSGRGNRQTESFDVISGALRVRWEARGGPAAGTGRLRVALCSAISGRELQTVVDHQGAGGASVDIADDPRVSYLLIESDQVDWTVTVEEASASAR